MSWVIGRGANLGNWPVTSPDEISVELGVLTLEDSDTTSPFVTGQAPAPSDTNVSRTSNIVLTIDDTESTVNQTTILIQVDLGAGYVTAYDGSAGGFQAGWNGAGSSISAFGPRGWYLSIDYTGTFPNYQGVTVRVVASDTAPVPNTLDTSYSFTTADTVAPYLANQNPAPSSTGIAVSSNVVVDVLDDGSGVDLATVNIEVKQGAGAFVPAVVGGTVIAPFDGAGSSVSPVAGGYRFTLDPTTDLASYTVIQIHVTAADTSFNALDTTYFFSTAALPFVENQSPANGATEVAGDTSFGFDIRDLDSGIDLSSVQVQVSVDGETPVYAVINGAVQASWGTGELYLLPDGFRFVLTSRIPFGTPHVVTVYVDGQDLDAPPNVMTQASWSFTTVYVKPVVELSQLRYDAVMGSIIQLDGRKSRCSDYAPIVWQWMFVQTPHGSVFERDLWVINPSSMTDLRPDLRSAVSFIPDKIGLYKVALTVYNGPTSSDTLVAEIHIGLTTAYSGEYHTPPDARFLFNFISNFWKLVEDREYFSTIWSSTIQLIGAELIKLWSNDYNKSLATIQPSVQRHWVKYPATTELIDAEQQRIIVGHTGSGLLGATTGVSGNTNTFDVLKSDYDFTQLDPNFGARGRIIDIGGLGYTIDRVFNDGSTSYAVMDLSGLTAGQSGLHWRLPHLLYIPSVNFETLGVSPGDVLVFEVTRRDTGLSVELNAQIVSVDRQRVGFEFRLSPLVLDIVSASNSTPIVVQTGRVVNGELFNVPHGLDTGKQVIVSGVVGNTAANGTWVVTKVDDNRFSLNASTGSSAYISGGSAEVTGDLLDHKLFQDLAVNLRIVSPLATDTEIAAAGEALIAFVPLGINLATRPFTQFQLIFKAKKIRHNTSINVGTDIVSIPHLQEKVMETPPVILQENWDYELENGYLNFVAGLFTALEPSPEILWAEIVHVSNTTAIENNFGNLIELKHDDLVAKDTRAPYLSAVKGIWYALTNGPTVANVRLAVQIAMGLPFSEERGEVVAIVPNFTVDSFGKPLGRMLIEDVDEKNHRMGVRRIYYYPMSLGLETNPKTGAAYKVGSRAEDIVERFVPLSKGVEVTDYVKDPYWWTRSLAGYEVRKYFIFKAQIDTDSDVFNEKDLVFSLEFLRKLKPAYTQIVAAALRRLEDNPLDLFAEGFVGGAVAKFYDNVGHPGALEATARLNDYNQQGDNLWNSGSRPFSTRSVLLTDVVTTNLASVIHASSAVGFGSFLRARIVGDATHPTIEGDLLAIHPGQPGAGNVTPGLYEVTTSIPNDIVLGSDASPYDPTTLLLAPPAAASFPLGSGLVASILRRSTNPVLRGTDLVTSVSGGINIGTSASSTFLSDGVSIDDHLIIESGANKGEYRIRSVVDMPAYPTPRDYAVTAGVPGGPHILETQVGLVNLDGSVPTLSAIGSQDFRIVRPILMKNVVLNAQVVQSGGQMFVECLDATDGNKPFDVFTPGLVGTKLRVANAQNPSNDGEWLVVEYIHAGSLRINKALATSDSAAQATVTLNSTYHPGFEKLVELAPSEAFRTTLTGPASMTGHAYGSSTLSALPLGFMVGQVFGSSVVSANIFGYGALAGTLASSSTLSGVWSALVAIVGSATSTSTLSGTTFGPLSMTGSSSGSSTPSGSLTGLGGLSGSSSGSSTLSGTLTT